MLINTYFKTLRKEKLMMVINWITVLVSLVITYIFAFVIVNINLTVLSITILLAGRCMLSELMLAKIIRIKVCRDVFLEGVSTVVFVTTAWYMNDIYGLLTFIIAYCIYLFVKRKDADEIFRLLLMLFRS